MSGDWVVCKRARQPAMPCRLATRTVVASEEPLVVSAPTLPAHIARTAADWAAALVASSIG